MEQGLPRVVFFSFGLVAPCIWHVSPHPGTEPIPASPALQGGPCLCSFLASEKQDSTGNLKACYQKASKVPMLKSIYK